MIDPATSIHLWPVFSVKMVAELDGTREPLVKERLDRLVAAGILCRWSQERPTAPDVYYLAPSV